MRDISFAAVVDAGEFVGGEEEEPAGEEQDRDAD